jgi:tetratricopeptide (TPR) repeat protein
LRNTYLLLGVGAALLVAATVVVVGAMERHDAQPPGAPAVAQTLPSGHPTVAATQGSGGAPSPAATAQGDLKQLEAIAKADPRDVTAQLKLGDAYFLAQRYTLAEKAYQSALHTRPGDPTATVRLAMVWHAGGQTQRAVRAIEGVLAQQPQDQEAHYSLAIIYFSMERVRDARSEWAKAAAIDPASLIGRRSQNFVDLIDGKHTSSGN